MVEHKGWVKLLIFARCTKANWDIDTITYMPHRKGGKMLTHGVLRRLARRNIQVNGIAPGCFKTEMTKALVEDRSLHRLVCTNGPRHRTLGDPGTDWCCGVSLSFKSL